MSNIDSMRGAVAFPEAGDGVYLRFRTADKADLQLEFGPSWFSDAHDRLNAFDIPFIVACLKSGAKRDGKRAEIDLDVLEDAGTFLTVVCERLLDALYVSAFGMPFVDHVKDRLKAAEDAAAEAAGEASPQPSPESSSEN